MQFEGCIGLLLSLFCGPGGLDLGFEEAGFEIGLAFDKNPDSIKTYNHNRRGRPTGFVRDIAALDLAALDGLFGSEFRPQGVVGGPPCQSFSQANRALVEEDDPRHGMPIVFADLLKALNDRSPVQFFAFENVKGLRRQKHIERFHFIKERFEDSGFAVTEVVLDASKFGVPQRRERLFLVGINKQLYPNLTWVPPQSNGGPEVSVRDAISWLSEPQYFSPDLDPKDFPNHVNHWCMQPKSRRFSELGALTPGNTRNRSFKTLAWDQPSQTVAYGNREVHIHPDCKRRLSVYEAMLLQGFPRSYELLGTLSAQINQVSEAVPPPLALAVAQSITRLLAAEDSRIAA